MESIIKIMDLKIIKIAVIFYLIYFFLRVIISRVQLSIINSEYFEKCSYNKHILEKGKNHFSENGIIICGLARDIERRIDYFMRNIENITSSFKDHLILMVENDSKDRTREILLKLKKKYNIIVLGCGIDADKCIMNLKSYGHVHHQSRIQKMVDLRNIYMDYFNEHYEEFKDKYQYTTIIDTDIVSNIYPKSIHHSGYYFKKYKEIDALGANSLMVPWLENYYDVYAVEELDNKKYLYQTKFYTYKFDETGTKKDLHKLYSSFGGFVIYRSSSLYNKRYELQLNERNVPLCEHVGIHKKMPNYYINPKMIIPIATH